MYPHPRHAAAASLLAACGGDTAPDDNGGSTSNSGGATSGSSSDDTSGPNDESSTGEPEQVARMPIHRTMAGGKDHACRIESDGSIACWIVGDAAVAPVPPEGTFVHIRAGDLTTCALTEAGAMRCWGAENLEHGGPWIDVDSVQGNVCALSPSGAVTCWGPLRAIEPPHPDGFVELMLVEEALGSPNVPVLFVCGLRVDDMVSCWGPPPYAESDEPWTWIAGPITPVREAIVMAHEIGFTNLEDAPESHVIGVVVCGRATEQGGKATCEVVRDPDPPEGVEPYLDDPNVGGPPVSVRWIDRAAEPQGEPHAACGRGDDGELWCWNPAALSGAPTNLGFPIVDAAPRSRCSLEEDDSVECWSPDAPDPVEPPATGATAIDGACALLEDGSLDCWGQLDALDRTSGFPFATVAASERMVCVIQEEPVGALRCRTSPSSSCDVPVGTYSAIAVDGDGVCALDVDGSAQCWTCHGDQTPGPVGPFDAIAMGDEQACALTDGVPTCWNPFTNNPKVAPTESFVKIVGGAVGTCGLTADGEVSCWPVDPKGAPSGPWTDVAAHESFEVVCGLREDGTARCWGPGSAMFTPPVTAFVAITAAEHVCGLTEAGAVHCWGSDPWDPLRWVD